jgi:hypothetical protein
MTAALNGSFNMYAQPTQAQTQAFQMQMMQMEIMRLQALQQAQAQQQQYQLEVARQQQQAAGRRASQYMEPATAGPTATSFARPRVSQAEQLKVQLHLNNKPMVEEPPMTAALGGKFGGRLNPNATTFRFGGGSIAEETAEVHRSGSSPPNNTPATPNYTTVISGGTALGLANGTSAPSQNTGTSPSKSDTALSWRRNSSVSNATRSVSVKITPPPNEREPSPPRVSPVATKSRPVPLRFSVTVHDPVVCVDGDSDLPEDVDDSSSTSTKSDSVPTTPPSGGTDSQPCMPPLSPREEATKRLYEGLGLGRPAPQSTQFHTNGFATVNTNTAVGMTFQNKVPSQPMRQPRGPPSGDELGPRNFAARIRRKAIGGLGAMLDARVNRREIEAF